MLSLNGALATAFRLPIHLASKIPSCCRNRKTSEISSRVEIEAKISNLVKKLESKMLLYSAAARTFQEHPEAFSDTDKFQKCSPPKALEDKGGEIETAIEELGSLAQRVGKRAINCLSKEQVEHFLSRSNIPFTTLQFWALQRKRNHACHIC